MTANIEKVEARIQEIVQTVNSAQKEINDMNIEYQRLIGYRQAIIDAQAETPQNEGDQVSDEPSLLKG